MAESDQGKHQESDEIKVTDRRQFTLDGTPRDDLEQEVDQEEEAAIDAPVEESAPPATESAGSFERTPIEEPEGVDFTMLINAMAQPALIFLGEIPHPGKGEPEVNLEQARLQIDLLDLLRIKCRGNLSAAEDGLMDRLLYQLRMLYVARSGQQPGG